MAITNKIIHYIEAPCGTGKTKGLISKINQSDGRYMIAVSTNKNGDELAKKIEGSIFINRRDGADKVYEQVEQIIAIQKVIIVTHAGLAKLLPIVYLLSNYELIVDELSGNLLEAPSLDISTDDYKHLKLYLKRNKSESKSIASVGVVEPLTLKDEYRNKDIASLSNELNGIMRVLNNGYPVVAISKKGSIKSIHSLGVSHSYLAILNGFKGVTVLSATVLNTFNHTLLSSLGYIFVESAWSIKASHKPFKGEVYVCQESKGISRRFLDKEVEGGDSVFSIYREKIKEKVDSAIWFVNKNDIASTRDYIFDAVNHAVVSLEQKGSNQYLSYDNAVCLFAVNPRPMQNYLLSSLERVVCLSEGDLVNAWTLSYYLEPIYQNCLRTSFRVQGEDSTNSFFIPDIRAYEYLKGKIPDLPKPIILFPSMVKVKDLRKGNSGNKPSYNDFDVIEMIELRLQKLKYQDIAEKLGLNISVIKRVFSKPEVRAQLAA